MLKLDIVKGVVVIDPISIQQKELREIYIADKGKNKDDATKMLTFIHLASQLDKNAPFYNADPTEIMQLIKQEVYGDYNYKWKAPYTAFTDDAVEEIIAAYQLAYESAEQAVVRSFDKKIHEIRRMIENTKLEIQKTVVKGAVTYASNFTILNKMMQDIPKITKAKEDVKTSILRDKAIGGDIQGGKKLSILERKRREMKIPDPVAGVLVEEEDDTEEENF